MNGYHISVADAQKASVWLPLATLDPPIGTDFSWVGQQCVTGDGAYVVATVAPSVAATEPADRAEGGFAYSISVSTGQVIPLLSNVTLASFSPACGVGDTVALTRYLTEDDSPTQVFLVNAATGVGTASFNDDAELTSAVPLSSSTALAVNGRQLVSLAHGSAKAAANLDEDGYDIVPDGGGGVDLMTASLADPTAAEIWHWQPGNDPTLIGRGSVDTTTVSPGRGGSVAVIGGQAVSSAAASAAVGAGASAVHWLTRPTGGGGVTGVSLNLDAELMTQGTATAPSYSVQGGTGGAQAITIPVAGSIALTPITPPAPASSPVAPGPAKTAGDTAPVTKVVGAGASESEGITLDVSAADQTTPLCAVPRLASNRQVLQPSANQIDWAIQQATQDALTQARNGDPTWALQPYTPDTDFPPSVTVPREVMSGVAMAESAWMQASYHANPGMPGDPLIANYYGESSDGTSWDYDNADCGYGLTQQTDGMEVGETQFSTNAQLAVALDYAENAAAGTSTMASKWTQLQQLGIIANDGEATMLENWYFAIWAYNTGIHPNDGSGNSGLGWSNNPINPASPRGDPTDGVPAHDFLSNSEYYNFDFSHPSDWPYQEQVIGYFAYGNEPFAASTQYPILPPDDLFCSTASATNDNCDPTNNTSPCELSNDHCWWSFPATWVSDCSTACTPGYWYIAPGAAEPPPSVDPYPPACVLPSGSGPDPAESVVVDSQPSDINMVGCPNPPSGWSNDGTYTTTFGDMAVIDYHQLGAGFGGHMYFTHAEDPGAWSVTGTWAPSLSTAGQYDVWVFIPSDGATVTRIPYQVTDGDGHTWTSVPVDQDDYNNQWVEIGSFPLYPGATVDLSNAIGANTSVDIGYSAVAFDLTSTNLGQPIIGGPVASSEVLGQTNCACANSDLGQSSGGDPVDTAFGNFTETSTDLSIPGRGIPLEFARTYNSLAATSQAATSTPGPLGYGWTSNLLMSLSQVDFSGPVTITQEGGAQVVFNQTVSGYTPSAPRVTATLSANSNDTWTFARQDGYSYTFALTGQLTSETDRNGYVTTLSYNGSGQLSKVTDPEGRALTIGWTGNNITSVTDLNVSPPRVVTLEYNDGNDNLTDVIDVDNGHTHFTYNSGHELTNMYDPNCYAMGVACNGGSGVVNTYNSAGQVSQQLDQLGRKTKFAYTGAAGTASGGSTTITDPANDVTVDTYENGLLTAETDGYGTANAATWLYAYDPVTAMRTSTTDPRGNVTKSAVDAYGNILSTTDAMGRFTSATYNGFNEPLTQTDGNGVTTTYTYDGNGNLLTTSTPLVGTTQVKTSIDSYGDGYPGDVTGITDPDAHTTAYTYDAYGDVATVTTPPAPTSDTTTTCYNADGWKVASYAPKAGSVPCGTSSPYETTYGYVQTNGLVDGFGDVQTVKAPLGNIALGAITTNTYDADRNLLSTTDPDNNRTSYVYDLANEQTEVKPASGDDQFTYYTLDGKVSYQKDANGNAVLTYGYNSLNQVTSETDALTRVTGFTYDGNGNELTEVAPGGSCTTTPATGCSTMTYDADNELTSVTYSDGVTPNVTGIGYDSDGQRTSMTDGTGPSSWTWDSLHEMTSYTDGAGAEVQYQYSLDGPVTQITYPGNLTVTDGYNNADQWTSVEDWLGNTFSFQYDADGNLINKTQPVGTSEMGKSAFNDADQLTSITDTQGSSTLFSATYGRGGDGQVTSDSSVPPGVGSYQYTDVNQLCYAGSANSAACTAPPSGSQAYGYDAAGNLTDDNGTAQTFNVDDELCWSVSGTSSKACSSAPTKAATYQYNAEGDLTTMTPSSGSTTNLGYDEADQLTSYGQGSKTTATYAYNGDGLRMSKTVSGVTTPYTWDVGRSEPLLIGDGTYDYVYGPGSVPLEQLVPQPAITLVGTANNSGTATSLTITLPTGTTAGEQVVVASTEPSTTTVTAPSGYAEVTSVTSAGSSPLATTTVFRHTVVAGETSVALTYSTATTAQAAVLAVYKGVDPNLPIDVSATGWTAAGLTVTTPAMTPVNAEDQLVVFQGATGTFSDQAWTAPTGTTERVQANTSPNVSAGLADQALTLGTTGSEASTFATSANLTSVSVALCQPHTISPSGDSHRQRQGDQPDRQPTGGNPGR